MIDTDNAKIMLGTGVLVDVNDQRLLALSTKGLAAAFLATTYNLQEVCDADLTKHDKYTFGEYQGLMWIRERLTQMGAFLSIELEGLGNHRLEIDDDFLSYVRKQLENED